MTLSQGVGAEISKDVKPYALLVGNPLPLGWLGLLQRAKAGSG